MPEPVFEWYTDKAGKFRFRLKAANGEVIAVSEAYDTKQGCTGGIESIKKNAPTLIARAAHGEAGDGTPEAEAGIREKWQESA